MYGKNSWTIAKFIKGLYTDTMYLKAIIDGVEYTFKITKNGSYFGEYRDGLEIYPFGYLERKKRIYFKDYNKPLNLLRAGRGFIVSIPKVIFEKAYNGQDIYFKLE